MNRTVAFAAVAVGVTTAIVIREIQHAKEIQIILETIKSEGTRTFLQAYSQGYLTGERDAVVSYAPGKMDELIEAQNKRP